MKTNQSRKLYRAQRGAMIAELGPALLILFFFLFFPLVDLLSLGMSYTSALALNELQVREAAFQPSSEAKKPGGQVRKTIPDQWTKSGLGRFVNLQQNPRTSVSYRLGESSGNGLRDKYVKVVTTILVNPFLNVPLLPGIPGISQSVEFTICSERIVENPSGVTGV